MPKAAAVAPKAPMATKVRVRALQTGYMHDRLYEEGDEFLMSVTAMKPAPGNHGDVIVTTKDGAFALPPWVEDAKTVRVVVEDEGDAIANPSDDVL